MAVCLLKVSISKFVQSRGVESNKWDEPRHSPQSATLLALSLISLSLPRLMQFQSFTITASFIFFLTFQYCLIRPVFVLFWPTLGYIS